MSNEPEATTELASMTMNDVMEFFDISRSTLNHWIKTREDFPLPVEGLKRVGTNPRWLWFRSEIEAYGAMMTGKRKRKKETSNG